MPVIGLTGGIAAGKSMFARLLIREVPMPLFDSDACVHELLAGDVSVKEAIRTAFGSEVFNASGSPDRQRIRDIIFEDQARRHQLEAILHPRVRSSWLEKAIAARVEKANLLVDVPLLYETGVAADFDRVIVIAASFETQIQRLVTNRGLAPGLAANIIRTQMDLGAKTRLADHVIWNDSTVSNLDGQSRLLAAWLRRSLA